MLMDGDCTTGRCGWWRTGSFRLSVRSRSLTARHRLQTNASTKLGICSHVEYVGVRILSRPLYFLFLHRPHSSFPHCPSLFFSTCLRILRIYTSKCFRSLSGPLCFNSFCCACARVGCAGKGKGSSGEDSSGCVCVGSNGEHTNVPADSNTHTHTNSPSPALTQSGVHPLYIHQCEGRPKQPL